MNRLEAVKIWLSRGLRWMAMGLLILMVALNFLHIFVRFLWNFPFLFISELNGYLLIWIGVLVLCAQLIRMRKDLIEGVRRQKDLLKRWRISVSEESLLLILALLAFVIGLRLMFQTMRQTSMVLDLPVGCFYAVVPLGAACDVLSAVINLTELRIIRGRLNI